MRVVFMGSSDFAVPALNAIVDRGHVVPAVYCQPPRPSGRGMDVRPSPVQMAADARGIPVETPASLKTESAVARFRGLTPDVAVVASYGLLLSPDILHTPPLGCLNIHASLLPRWRGASPIQHAIWYGDTETGVTIMQMDEGLDTGAVLAMESIPISARDTAGLLHDRLATLGARMIVEVLNKVSADMPNPIPQDDENATYAPKLGRDDGHLDWTRSAIELERQVRAFDPWPGTWTDVGEERLRVHAVEIEATSGASTEAPGTLMPGGRMVVRCGDGGLLRLVRVQRPGRKVVADDEFLRGLRSKRPTVLR